MRESRRSSRDRPREWASSDGDVKEPEARPLDSDARASACDASEHEPPAGGSVALREATACSCALVASASATMAASMAA